MELSDLAGPSLPSWFLLPATGFFALLTLYFIFRTRGRAARFLLFACWLRYTLSSLHEFTYNDALPGVKWVALGSLAIVGAGLLLLEKRRLFAKPFFPVAIICTLMLVSATINHQIGSAIEPIVRFLVFVIIAVALWQALETNGSAVFRRLLLVFIQPLSYQLASVLLGVAKSGELDGSVSYIGGYYHEELFSLIGATCFFVAMFTPRLGKFTRLAIAIASLSSIALANYRTTMLGVVPLAMVALFISIPRAFEPGQRAFAKLIVVLGGIALIGATAGLEQDRFSDLADIRHATEFIKPPEEYTNQERSALSYRPYIWSTYISAYAEGTRVEKVIGFGPDSWEGRMPNYAHNTIISFLYELGLVGMAAILLLWWSFFRLALRADQRSRALLIGGHVSFFVLNLATMAHWEIEGNILYGLLAGYTIAKARKTRVIRVLARRQQRLAPPSWASAPVLVPAPGR